MPRNAISRVFATSICTSCRTRIRHGQPSSLTKAFSTTSLRPAEQDSPFSRPAARRARPSSGLAEMYSAIQGRSPEENRASTRLAGVMRGLSPNSLGGYRDRSTTGLSAAMDPMHMIAPNLNDPNSPLKIMGPPPEPHHFHIYCTKHNTHITLTRPNREPILSFSSGNIGFRKAQRGSYDAGFQLAAYVMKMIQDRGLLRSPMMQSSSDEMTTKGKRQESAIQTLEVVIRGFGKGREAVVKALLGNEGRNLRGRVVKISDATRLKFGGTRSPNPRRLG